MIKIGDKVRFLNATGEGKVVGFQGKDIVLVRDADDFDIPTHVRDLVVISATDQYNFPTEELPEESPKKAQKAPTATIEEEEEDEPELEIPPYSFNEYDETPEGEQLSVYLAFVPTDIKHLDDCKLDVYLINESNYYLTFNLLNVTSEVTLQQQNTIEPQTKLLLDTIDKVAIGTWEKVRFQALPFKKKAFEAKPVIDVTLDIKPTRFYKLHSFRENDFFDTEALMLTIVENDVYDFAMQIDANKLQQAIQQKEQPERRQHLSRSSKPKNEPIEVDLHINALLDTTAGMNNADMLQYQLDTFNKVMREHLHHRGQKIVFIHGKGEGVLRAAIEKELRTKYRSCYFQDASFQQYGFGATQVTIR